MKFTCCECAKIVQYSKQNETHLIKRVGKSGLSEEDFAKNFKCQKCAKGVLRKEKEFSKIPCFNATEEALMKTFE